MSFFTELKRRNVIRVAVAYAVASWLLIEAATVALEGFGAPEWVPKAVATLLALGFPVALFFAWAFEITPEGIKRESEVDRSASLTHETAKKLDLMVIVLLVAAIGLYGIDRFFFAGSSSAEIATPEPALPAEAVVEEITEASVAVLPFTTRSRNQDDVFFSDGLHDDLLTQLAKIGDLKVISRTSVMEYRDTAKKIPAIAAELGVATVVEGAVQRSGDMVRITAQLIEAETDEHLWAETYDSELTADNLFAIQTEIATSIATALKATLSPSEQAQLNRQFTDDLEALQAFQRARRQVVSFDANVVRQVLADLDYAVQRDPEFAAAYALRSRMHMWRYWVEEADDIHRQRSLADLERARAADPDSPEADIAEGIYHYWGFREYRKALEVLEPALEAYPNDADLLNVISWVNRRLGRFDVALEHMERAVELDPRNLNGIATLGETLLTLGRYDEVPAVIAAGDAIAPDHPRLLSLRAGLALNRDGDAERAAHFWRLSLAGLSYAPTLLYHVQLQAGDFEGAVRTAAIAGSGEVANNTWNEAGMRGIAKRIGGLPDAEEDLQQARAELEAQLAADPDNGAHELALCGVVGAQGDIEAARLHCDRALENMLPDAFDYYRFHVVSAAQGLAMAGAHDRAFELLRESIENEAGERRHSLVLHPAFRALHDDPRWDDLVEDAEL